MRYLFGYVVGMLVLVGGLVGIAQLANGSTAGNLHKCAVSYPASSRISAHVVNNRASLDGWTARHHIGVYPVIDITSLCEQGSPQYTFIQYIDGGNLHARMHKGTVLWAW